jgi:hypothetical protein
MNKVDLLAALESKFEAVLSTEKKSEVADVSYYVANVFDVVGDTGRTVNIMFFVKDEGQPEETAYWGNSEPKPAPGPATFAQEAQAWLQSKIDATVGDKIVRMFDQLSADNTQKRARVRLTLEDTEAGTLSSIEVALWKTAEEFQYKVIT